MKMKNYIQKLDNVLALGLVCFSYSLIPLMFWYAISYCHQALSYIFDSGVYLLSGGNKTVTNFILGSVSMEGNGLRPDYQLKIIGCINLLWNITAFLVTFYIIYGVLATALKVLRYHFGEFGVVFLDKTSKNVRSQKVAISFFQIVAGVQVIYYVLVAICIAIGYETASSILRSSTEMQAMEAETPFFAWLSVFSMLGWAFLYYVAMNAMGYLSQIHPPDEFEVELNA